MLVLNKGKKLAISIDFILNMPTKINIKRMIGRNNIFNRNRPTLDPQTAKMTTRRKRRASTSIGVLSNKYCWAIYATVRVINPAKKIWLKIITRENKIAIRFVTKVGAYSKKGFPGK